LASSWASRAVAAAQLFQTGFACVHMYILYACVYVCVSVYVCGHDICIYMHVCMYKYIYAFIHMCMCMCMHIWCIDWGSWYQCFSVWTVSCMRMCFRVHMHAYTYVCRYMYMCIFFAVSVTCTLQVLWALVHGRVCMFKFPPKNGVTPKLPSEVAQCL